MSVMLAQLSNCTAALFLGIAAGYEDLFAILVLAGAASCTIIPMLLAGRPPDARPSGYFVISSDETLVLNTAQLRNLLSKELCSEIEKGGGGIVLLTANSMSPLSMWPMPKTLSLGKVSFSRKTIELCAATLILGDTTLRNRFHDLAQQIHNEHVARHLLRSALGLEEYSGVTRDGYIITPL